MIDYVTRRYGIRTRNNVVDIKEQGYGCKRDGRKAASNM